MAGGIYSALSGLQSRATRLDHIAEDIANAGTSGYKGGRHTSMVSERQTFSATLDSAVDVVVAPSRVDFRPGENTPTGRDLDLAIEGPGFFEIQTAVSRGAPMERSSPVTVTPSWPVESR
jgi:flagellar hook-basal body protein